MSTRPRAPKALSEPTTAFSLAAISIALAAAAIGCGGASPPIDPITAAIDTGAARVQRATTRAGDASLETRTIDTWIRFNPAQCECPPWEVSIGGEWVRCELVVGRGATPEVAELLAAPAGDHSAVSATVSLSRGVVESETGWRYPELEVEAVGSATTTPPRRGLRPQPKRGALHRI